MVRLRDGESKMIKVDPRKSRVDVKVAGGPPTKKVASIKVVLKKLRVPPQRGKKIVLL